MPINIYNGTALQKIGTDVATQLANPRTITLSGVTATGQLFDGTADVTIPITAVPATLLTGTASINTTGSAGSINGTQNGVTTTINAENSSYTYYKTSSTDGHYFNKDLVINGAVYPYRENVSDVRNLGLSNAKWDNVYATTFNGNATSATVATSAGQLTSTRTIALSGIVSGTTTTNLSSDITINTDVQVATDTKAGIISVGEQTISGPKTIAGKIISSTSNAGIDIDINGTTSSYIRSFSFINSSTGIQHGGITLRGLAIDTIDYMSLYCSSTGTNTHSSANALRIYQTYVGWGTKRLLNEVDDIASITKAGIVTIGDQSFAGAKHFPQGLSSYALEFTDIASTAGNGGYIDFHFNGNTADYTSRIIESSSGQLNLIAANNVLLNGNAIATVNNLPGIASATNDGLISTGTQTIAGIKTFSSGIITPSIITSLSEYYTALGNVSGSLTIAFVSSAKNIVTMTCTAATTLSFTQTGAYSSGANTYTLIITNGGGRITWPSTVKWADGTPPDLTASGVDIITLLSLGGANLYYGVAATNFS